MREKFKSITRLIDARLNLPLSYSSSGNLAVLELHNSLDWVLTYDNGKDARYYVLSNSDLFCSKKIRTALKPIKGSHYDFSFVSKTLGDCNTTMREIDHTKANSY